MALPPSISSQWLLTVSICHLCPESHPGPGRLQKEQQARSEVPTNTSSPAPTPTAADLGSEPISQPPPGWPGLPGLPLPTLAVCPGMCPVCAEGMSTLGTWGLSESWAWPILAPLHLSQG